MGEQLKTDADQPSRAGELLPKVTELLETDRKLRGQRAYDGERQELHWTDHVTGLGLNAVLSFGWTGDWASIVLRARYPEDATGHSDQRQLTVDWAYSKTTGESTESVTVREEVAGEEILRDATDVDIEEFNMIVDITTSDYQRGLRKYKKVEGLDRDPLNFKDLYALEVSEIDYFNAQDFSNL